MPSEAEVKRVMDSLNLHEETINLEKFVVLILNAKSRLNSQPKSNTLNGRRLTPRPKSPRERKNMTDPLPNDAVQCNID